MAEIRPTSADIAKANEFASRLVRGGGVIERSPVLAKAGIAAAGFGLALLATAWSNPVAAHGNHDHGVGVQPAALSGDHIGWEGAKPVDPDGHRGILAGMQAYLKKNGVSKVTVAMPDAAPTSVRQILSDQGVRVSASAVKAMEENMPVGYQRAIASVASHDASDFHCIAFPLDPTLDLDGAMRIVAGDKSDTTFSRARMSLPEMRQIVISHEVGHCMMGLMTLAKDGAIEKGLGEDVFSGLPEHRKNLKENLSGNAQLLLNRQTAINYITKVNEMGGEAFGALHFLQGGGSIAALKDLKTLRETAAWTNSGYLGHDTAAVLKTIIADVDAIKADARFQSGKASDLRSMAIDVVRKNVQTFSQFVAQMDDMKTLDDFKNRDFKRIPSLDAIDKVTEATFKASSNLSSLGASRNEPADWAKARGLDGLKAASDMVRFSSWSEIARTRFLDILYAPDATTPMKAEATMQGVYIRAEDGSTFRLKPDGTTLAYDAKGRLLSEKDLEAKRDTEAAAPGRGTIGR
jgi:hypothetical protein